MTIMILVIVLIKDDDLLTLVRDERSGLRINRACEGRPD